MFQFENESHKTYLASKFWNRFYAEIYFEPMIQWVGKK